jgi:hypothetical protein
LQFSKAGDLLVALCEGELCVWDTRTGNQVVKQNSGELYSLWESFVEPDSEPPMVAMLRQTKPPSYSSAYEGQVDFLTLPSGETHTTIGPVQIEPDVHVFWGREKASLRISGDQKIAVTLQPAAGDIPATQFKRWDISSGKLLATLVVSRPPIRWTISQDGAELIQLTDLVSPASEQAARSLTGRWRPQIEYWEFESRRLRKRLVADEKSVAQLVFENCTGLRPASDSSLLLVSTMAGQCLVDTSGDRLDLLANDLESLISPDGSLIAAQQGKVFRAPFIGRVNTQSIELKRMPAGEVLRTIESHSGWPEDEVAFDPLAFSQDQQKLIYVDYTDSGPWALVMAHCGDLWNGSLLHGDSIRQRTYCIRSMDISTGRTNVILRSARLSRFSAAVLGNQYVLVGDRVWRLSGGSPWLHILGLPTGVVAVVLIWKYLRQRRKTSMRKHHPGTTN